MLQGNRTGDHLPIPLKSFFVTNMFGGYGNSDIKFSDKCEYGGAAVEYVHLIGRSPIGYVDKVETLILLLL